MRRAACALHCQPKSLALVVALPNQVRRTDFFDSTNQADTLHP